ncbi:Hypothetical predicted protein [Mytilus galloprovincialis]|uniref:DDE Tnp4 domain-containing protein n=1 Tax=Mytilus galloprovincialis TaxID=29158 RepID=A0A8B6FNH2_MYTGA|nr:Hypothetical predicted protein [Mytilus galloprovincialis]
MAAYMQVPLPPHRKERHFRLKDDLSFNLSNEVLRERSRFDREGNITRKTKRNHTLTVPQMFMLTLRVLATGSYLQVDTIGAIDGIHVRIQAPSEDEASFVNRKGVNSVNVQAVCDARGEIFLN